MTRTQDNNRADVLHANQFQMWADCSVTEVLGGAKHLTQCEKFHPLQHPSFP